MRTSNGSCTGITDPVLRTVDRRRPAATTPEGDQVTVAGEAPGLDRRARAGPVLQHLDQPLQVGDRSLIAVLGHDLFRSHAVDRESRLPKLLEGATSALAEVALRAQHIRTAAALRPHLNQETFPVAVAVAVAAHVAAVTAGCVGAEAEHAAVAQVEVVPGSNVHGDVTPGQSTEISAMSCHAPASRGGAPSHSSKHNSMRPTSVAHSTATAAPSGPAPIRPFSPVAVHHTSERRPSLRSTTGTARRWTAVPVVPPVVSECDVTVSLPATSCLNEAPGQCFVYALT